MGDEQPDGGGDAMGGGWILGTGWLCAAGARLCLCASLLQDVMGSVYRLLTGTDIGLHCGEVRCCSRAQ